MSAQRREMLVKETFFYLLKLYQPTCRESVWYIKLTVMCFWDTQPRCQLDAGYRRVQRKEKKVFSDVVTTSSTETCHVFEMILWYCSLLLIFKYEIPKVYRSSGWLKTCLYYTECPINKYMRKVNHLLWDNSKKIWIPFKLLLFLTIIFNLCH